MKTYNADMLYVCHMSKLLGNVCVCKTEREREDFLHVLSVVVSPAECLIMQLKVSKCQMLWSNSFFHSAPLPLQ